MSEAALALVEEVPAEKPSALIRRATDVAEVCKAAVLATVMTIKGKNGQEKRYIKVEGWCTIAAAYACAPSIREVIEEERGIRAIADLRRADGTVVSSAEGFCGLDEPDWSNRAMYARRGMAQTRAISRVCRTAFAFVVTLMDAGLSTTPAEEIPSTGEDVPLPSGAASTMVVGAAPSAAPRVALAPERSKKTQVRYGRSKGKHLCDIDAKDLAWQLNAARKSVESEDPKWHDDNVAWCKIVEAEVARRG